MLLVVAYAVPILALLVMLIILLQGETRHKELSMSFRILLIFLISWLSLLWTTDQINNPTVSIITLRFALFFASFVPAIFFYFGTRLINQSNKLVQSIFLIISLVFAVLSLTPYMVSAVSKGQLGVSIPHDTSTYYLQTIYTVGALIFTYLWIRKSAQSAQEVFSKNISQIKSMGNGMLIALTLGVLGVFIHQSIGHLILPVALTIFALSVFIAVFKHGLFDIRLIVARSVAYIFSLLIVGATFGFLTYMIGSVFIQSSTPINTSLGVSYTVIAVILALIFPQIKKFFDRATKSVFYRDGYDVQEFLDSFNRVLVSTYKIKVLLGEASNVIERNLKPSYCLFSLRENKDAQGILIDSRGNSQSLTPDLDLLSGIAQKVQRRVIVTDLLEQQFFDQQKQLQDKDISIMVKLSNPSRNGGMGFLVMGPKKSGSMYTSQDTKVLEIVANELVVAIQNSLHTEEIERFNITLQTRIKEATHKLRSTNEKLMALDEAKDDFLSMASHQLRTPLTSIKGNLSLVLEGDTGRITELQRKMLQQAFSSSQRMVYLISDLLNVSRLKTGKFVIERTPVNLVTLVKEEIGQLLETAKSRNLTLNYIAPKHIEELMLDDNKTRQVIMNFIDNAIYYTPSGGEIDVYVKETQSAVECRVVDNGIGVPKNEVHHLFTKFYRAKNARKARPDGTGLGLFMAKKVIVSEGGALIFDSAEGKGSTFGFSFPKSKLVVNNTNALTPSQEPSAVAQNA